MYKPKLLYVITQGGPWGGAQKYVFDLARELRDKFDVSIAVGEPDGQLDLQAKAQMFGITVYQLKHLIRPISPWHDLLAILELRRLYKKINPDIIHLNSSKAGVIGSIAGQMPSVRCQVSIVYTAHGWVFTEPMGYLKRWLYKMLEAQSARWKDAIIILSRADLDLAKKLLMPEKKLKWIPHSVGQVIEFLPRQIAREKLTEMIEVPIPPANYWVGCIANFYPTKGLDILLRAIASERTKLSNAHFFLIGDGPEKKRLEGLVAQLRIADLMHLVGFVPDASQYLPAFDLFVLPSRKEGSPYALLEAIEARVPIVATSVGGIPDLLEDGKNAKIVPPDKVLPLAEALVFAREHPKDMERYAANAYQLEASLDRMLDQITLLYQSLLAAKSH